MAESLFRGSIDVEANKHAFTWEDICSYVGVGSFAFWKMWCGPGADPGIKEGGLVARGYICVKCIPASGVWGMLLLIF